MAIYVLDPEAVLAFRRNHRAEVQKQRRQKRRKDAEKPRDRGQFAELDRQWMAAVDRDRS